MKKILFTAFSLIFIAVISFGQYRIDTPQLLGPDDGDTEIMPDALLNWTAVLNATGYQVVVGTNENLNNPIVDEVTSLSAFQNEYLMFNSTYYWKVRAIQGDDFSAWSDTRSFTTFQIIELTDPDDGEDGLQALVELEWEDKYGGNTLSGFDAYQIQVDLNLETLLNGTPEWNIFFEEGNGFKYDLNYTYYGDTMYWRVRTVHPNDTCPWPEPFSFITDNEIELDKPNNGTTNANLEFFIEWDEFDGTSSYEYQVHTLPSFNGSLTFFVDSTEVPVPTLMYGTEYFWRVRGKNLRDTTAWCEPWSFVTADMVELVEPINMIDSVELNPTLSWEPIEGSRTYDVEYSTDPTFAETSHINIASTFINIGTALEEGTEYFWRVRANAVQDTSSYTEPWSFTTIGAIGIEEYLNTETVSIYPNPAIDKATLTLSAKKAGNAAYSLSDLTGQEIQKGSINITTGINTLELNVDGMAKGIYLVNININENMLTRKLIIK
jgi:hypothetical protein